MKTPEWTLPEAARLLGEPQHRLIHLCERRAVVPDLGEASGRGSSRRFSARNMLEFAIALKLQELMLPVGAIAAVLQVLRRFEDKVSSEIPSFELPQSLRGPKAPEITAVIGEGPRLYFTIGRGGRARLFGGVPLRRAGLGSAAPGRQRISLNEINPASEQRRSPLPAPYDPEAGARIEISITRVAKELPLDR